jgi:hypothetical protein
MPGQASSVSLRISATESLDLDVSRRLARRVRIAGVRRLPAEAVSKPSAHLQIERNEQKIPSVIQICEISRFEFCRIPLQRGRFLF